MKLNKIKKVIMLHCWRSNSFGVHNIQWFVKSPIQTIKDNIKGLEDEGFIIKTSPNYWVMTDKGKELMEYFSSLYTFESGRCLVMELCNNERTTSLEKRYEEMLL